MKSSWKKQRQATKKRNIKMSRLKRRLLKKYGLNIEGFTKLYNAIRVAISNVLTGIGKAFNNLGEGLRPSNTSTVAANHVSPIGLGADMKCYVEDILGGRP